MSTDTLLVELGTEELPPKALKSLGLAFRDGIVDGLKQRQLGFRPGAVVRHPTALGSTDTEVQLQAPDRTLKFSGRRWKRSGQGGELDTVPPSVSPKSRAWNRNNCRPSIPPRAYVWVCAVRSLARHTRALNAIINASIQDLPIPRRMRWGASREEFVRPVHWVVAMLGTR